MPRLTNKRYVEMHHLLRKSWLQYRHPFTQLTPREQWDLHHFFIPAEQRTDAELIEHRAQIAAVDQSLPQRAGRAYRRFEVEQQIPRVPALQHTPHTKSDYAVVVRGLVWVQPNIELVARVLMEVTQKAMRMIM